MAQRKSAAEGIQVALVVVAALLGACSGSSGADRDCVVEPGTFTPISDRIAIASCGDGSICIGACGGQQDSGNTTDSNNPDNSTNDSNNPQTDNRRNR